MPQPGSPHSVCEVLARERPWVRLDGVGDEHAGREGDHGNGERSARSRSRRERLPTGDRAAAGHGRAGPPSRGEGAAEGSRAGRCGNQDSIPSVQSSVRRSAGFHGVRGHHAHAAATTARRSAAKGRARRAQRSPSSRNRAVSAATATAASPSSAPKCHGHLLGVATRSSSPQAEREAPGSERGRPLAAASQQPGENDERDERDRDPPERRPGGIVGEQVVARDARRAS